jgi:methylamine--corrinoid protein Co-methyltransferase
MVVTRALTIYDVYDRFVKGKRVPESEWDYNIIPQNATALKEKYKLDFGKNSVPEDNKTKNDLFQAGLEMLVNTGYYCQDLGRVMKVTEEEVWEGIKKTPTKLEIGEGRDVARFYPRHGNSPVKPIIQGGPTGSPISEDIFVQVMQSYAQEAVIDTLVNGVMTTTEGHPAKSGTPYEIRATMAELRATKEAKIRAGRPGLSV